MTRPTLVVRVTLSVTVDRAAWREAYGEDQTADDIREAVRTSIAAAAADPGVIAPADIILDVQEARPVGRTGWSRHG